MSGANSTCDKAIVVDTVDMDKVGIGFRTPSGRSGFLMNPAAARDLAAELIDAANKAEAHASGRVAK